LGDELSVKAPTKIEGPKVTVGDLFTVTPLYRPVPLTDLDPLLKELQDDDLQIDCYCIWCNSESIFKRAHDRAVDLQQRLSGITNNPLQSRFTGYRMVCQRQKTHEYFFLFSVDGENFLKIGQYPSLEDVTGKELQKFRSVLDRNDYAELHRANGLASHGIGIGAFVYLRRIFERLIRAYQVEYSAKGGAISNFHELRMDEKIQTLKDVLPRAIVKNKATYGILSNGLHELDEDTCKKYFPVVRSAIILMLEQHLQAKEQEKIEKELERNIQDISSTLRNKSAG
jgi:hypothetical protein